MPVVPCPHCTNPVTLPPTWGGAAYTCPHCRRVAGGSPPPRPVAPPPPVPPPPPSLSFPEEDRDPDPPRRYRQPTGSPVADFFTFRLMITPVLIQVVFWAGTAGCVLRGGLMMIESLSTPAEKSRATTDRESNDADKSDKKAKSASATRLDAELFAVGVAIMAFGPLLIRLYCELMIIIFKIHDELKAANDRRGRT